MRQRWFSRRALLLHLVVLIVVPTFLRLCVWQIDRALSGNELSWAYVFEWPFFAGYALYLWWKLIHDESNDKDVVTRDEKATAKANKPAGATSVDRTEDPSDNSARSIHEREDEELAAYNRYLGELNASTRTRY